MNAENIREYLSPMFKNVTDEEISLIGIAVFGSNLNYVKSELPEIYKSFKRYFHVEESETFDRSMLHYVVTQVEPTKRSFETPSGAKFQMNKKPSLQDVLNKSKSLRK